MARTQFESVSEYLAAQPAAAQAALRRVRSTLRKALPGTEEVITYQMPTYELAGGAVIFFAGWKQHYSIYPATAQVVTALGDQLAPYEVEKGTIRFPLAQAVPVKLIERIARLRAKEVAASQRAKAAAKTAAKTR